MKKKRRFFKNEKQYFEYMHKLYREAHVIQEFDASESEGNKVLCIYLFFCALENGSYFLCQFMSIFIFSVQNMS